MRQIYDKMQELFGDISSHVEKENDIPVPHVIGNKKTINLLKKEPCTGEIQGSDAIKSRDTCRLNSDIMRNLLGEGSKH